MKIIVNNKYRIRIALVAVVIGFVIGWHTPIWMHKHIEVAGLDGKIAECLFE